MFFSSFFFSFFNVQEWERFFLFSPLLLFVWRVRVKKVVLTPFFSFFFF